MPINPLNDHYSFTAIPSVYDEEALDALELAGRTAAKVNEAISAFNNLETDTGNQLKGQDAKLAAQDAKLAAQDVSIPVKVNAAIDKNIADGTFDRAINEYAGDLEARLDHIIENAPNLDGAMSAEVVDARKDGDTIYPTLKDSIHGQINSGIAKTNVIDDINRFNPLTVTYGSILNAATGELKTDENYITSDFIPVKAGENLHYNVNLYPLTVRYIVYYAENKSYLSVVEVVNKTTIPEDAAYMRISFAVDNNPTDIMVTRAYYGNTFVKSGDKIKYDVGDAAIYKVAYGNRYNPDKRLDNAYVSHLDGRTYVPEGTSDYVVSDLIPIFSGETLKLCNNEMLKYPIRFCVGYDENFNFVEGVENVATYTQSGDVKYVRVTIPASAADSAIICEDAQTEYLTHGKYTIKNVGGNKQLNNLLGGGARSYDVGTLSGNTRTFPDFPSSIKNNAVMSLYARITTIRALDLGFGYYTKTYGGLYMSITSSGVTLKQYINDNEMRTLMTTTHNLTLSDYIHVVLKITPTGANFKIQTKNGVYSSGVSSEIGITGTPFVTSGPQIINCATVSLSCLDFSKPLWAIGDSYFGYTNDRVMGQLHNLGYDNMLVMGRAGMKSPEAYNDLETALQYGTPKYLIWYMGMNDSVSDYEETLAKLIQLCNRNNITLILNNVPTTPTQDKEDIAVLTRTSGCRNINSYGVVGTNPSGTWYEGALSADNVHPTEYGAQLLAIRMLQDVPEILSYGGVS